MGRKTMETICVAKVSSIIFLLRLKFSG